MNDEIKEILSYLKKKENTRRIKCITIEESKQLLDYITNLQQEKEKLEIALQNIQEDYDKRVEEYERLKQIIADYVNVVLHDRKVIDDYKSRCEKASEKLGNYKHYSTPTEEQNSENEDIVDSALNLLQNGSDSQC